MGQHRAKVVVGDSGISKRARLCRPVVGDCEADALEQGPVRSAVSNRGARRAVKTETSRCVEGVVSLRVLIEMSRDLARVAPVDDFKVWTTRTVEAEPLTEIQTDRLPRERCQEWRKALFSAPVDDLRYAADEGQLVQPWTNLGRLSTGPAPRVDHGHLLVRQRARGVGVLGVSEVGKVTEERGKVL